MAKQQSAKLFYVGSNPAFYSNRKLGRVVDCNGLENRLSERVRGFESYSFRHMVNVV